MSTNSGPEDWSQQQPQAGGYPPPTPLNHNVPAPVTLPKSLDTSVKLWVVAAAISLVHSILTIVNTDALIDEYSVRLGVSLDAARGSVAGVGSVIFQLVMIGIWLFFVWQMRSGQNWARIVLTVVGGIVLLSGVIGLLALGVYFSIGALGVLEVLLSLASLATIAAAMVFQFKADANPFFTGR